MPAFPGITASDIAQMADGSLIVGSGVGTFEVTTDVNLDHLTLSPAAADRDGLIINLPNSPTGNAIEVNTFGGSGGNRFLVANNGHTTIQNQLNVAGSSTVLQIKGGDTSWHYITHAKGINFESNQTIRIRGPLSLVSEVHFGTETHNTDSGTTSTIDWTTGNKQALTLTNDCTLSFTAPRGCCSLTLRIIQGGVGGHMITWPAMYWPGGLPPTLTSEAGSVDVVNLYYDGTNYYGEVINDFQLVAP